MRRRGFLGLLLALPFAPALAEAAAKTIKKPLDPRYVARVANIDLSGADQTSIWLVNWTLPRGRMHSRPQMTYAMWRDSIQYNGIPVRVSDSLGMTEAVLR